MIDAGTVSAIFGALIGAWMLGFGVGKAVAWIRNIASVA